MTTSTWNGSTADWSDSADWSGGTPNSSTITAVIGGTGAYTLTLAGNDPTYSVGAVTMSDAKAIFDFDGVLVLTGAFTLTAGTVDLAGVLSGGVLKLAGGTVDYADGTLAGVTVDGTVDLKGGDLNAGDLTLTGANGTGAGMLDIDQGGNLYLLNTTQTLDNATINIGTDGSDGDKLYFDQGGGSVTLTLGPALSIIAGKGELFTGQAGGEVINKGTITVGAIATAGGVFDIESNGAPFVNQGTITVTDDEDLFIQTGSFVNTGVITVTSGAILELNVDFSSGLPSGITIQSGGTLQLDTAVTNAGTITTTAGETLLLTSGDTIAGGAFVEGPGIVDFDNDSFSGVKVDGALDLKGGDLNVVNVTLAGAGGTGAGMLDIDQGGELAVKNTTQTLDDATIDIGIDGSGGDKLFFDQGGGSVTLTLGTALSIVAGKGELFVGQAGGVVINQGSITIGAAATSDNYFSVFGSGGFVNQGTIIIEDGEALELDTATCANNGLIAVTSGELVLEGTIGGTGLVTIGAGAMIAVASSGAVAAPQTFDFAGGGGQLLLNDASGTTLNFAGTIAGFGNGETIDLGSFAFSGNPSVAWAQNGAGGMLTVTDGADTAKLALLGKFNVAEFTKMADANGDTDITISYKSKYINTAVYGTSGYTLDGQFQSITIGPKGVIGGAGLAGGAAESYAIVNQGKVTGAYIGVLLKGGGSVTNSTTAAQILGSYIGVALDGGGAVGNAGTIEGTGKYGIGVDLTAGGSVTNSGVKSIIVGIYAAVEIAGATGTVINDGLIRAPVNSTALFMRAGGSVTNAKGATIEGFDAVSVDGGFSTIANTGTIAGNATAGFGIYLGASGSVANAAGALLTGLDGILAYGGGTVTNTGTIKGNATSGLGIDLEDGGKIANDAGGLIEGWRGAGIEDGGTLNNAGTIEATGSYGIGVLLGDGGAIINSGKIEARNAGIYLANGGAVTNNGGGSIYSMGYYSIDILNGSGVVTNAATLTSGVKLGAGGSVANNVKTALIEGFFGVLLQGVGTVTNAGTIDGFGAGGHSVFVDDGVYLGSGGNVINGVGALIEGYAGVLENAVGTVTNAGTIDGLGSRILVLQADGVDLNVGGSVINSVGALIEGYAGVDIEGAVGTVTNAGTIEATGTYGGVLLGRGGAVINSGKIEAHNIGVYLGAAGSVTNNAGGSIYSMGYYSIDILNGSGVVTNAGTLTSGVKLGAGGSVANNVKTAVIKGFFGVLLQGVGMVTNAGTIDGFGAGGHSVFVDDGVYLGSGGNVINGVGALIEGYAGVLENAVGTVTNAGTIDGLGSSIGLLEAYGVDLNVGGSVINNVGALIKGYAGVCVTTAVGTVTNIGTIKAVGTANLAFGVDLAVGGVVTNATGALIEGFKGVYVKAGTATIINSGKIDGSIGNGDGGVGIQLGDGGIVTNNAGASIEGTYGVVVDAVAAGSTVRNAGTIASSKGAAGTAVLFGISGVTLVDIAGADFIGKVIGDAGRLEFSGIGGTLAGLGTQFTGFQTEVLEAGSAWTFSGANSVASGTTFSNLGTLVDTGVLTLDGTSMIAGVISGTGSLALAGGTMLIHPEADLTVAKWSVSNTAVIFGAGLSYGGSFTESVGTFSLAGHNVSFAGSVGFTGGTVISGGLLTTHGTVSLAGLALQGGANWLDIGTVKETAALTLGNSGNASGYLLIAAGGIFDITANVGIAIASNGAGTLGNAGLFEKTAGTGAGTIAPAISNTGTLLVTAGTLDLQGAVTGAGKSTIGSAGTLKFDGSVVSTQTITFAGTTGGDLVLNDPSGSGLSFAGTVAGFSGSDKIDLTSFAFSGTPTFAWTQSGAKGTLKVADGSSVASITLFGQYSLAGFKKTQDAGTGTFITYTPLAPAVLASTHH